MHLLGLNISRTKAEEKALAPVAQSRGWYRIIEAFAGAWQRNVEIRYDDVLSNHADFSCRTLIASDISKLRIRLVRKDENDIWTETTNPAYSPVLRKPNHFQNRIQFMETWVLSKLQRGNAVILKQRDGRGVVKALYVLDWALVTPLVANDGSVFYQLNTDNLAGLPEAVTVPAREIIHDRFNCFYHPLVGLSPIFAGGLAATHGLAIHNDSTTFFQNGAQLGGILTAPGAISDETAKRLKEHREQNFSGKNSGKVAVLGDGLKYEAMRAKAVDSQLIEQLKWSAEVVCSTYHVPPYNIGVGTMPTNNNVEALNIEYYSPCVQVLIEAIELCLDEGLGMGETIGTEFDIDNLLRTDTTALTNAEKEAVGAGIKVPNEARKHLNLGPKPGGNSPYQQQQNYSLEALAKRDAQADPFGTAPSAPASEPEPKVDETNKGLFMRATLRKELGLAAGQHPQDERMNNREIKAMMAELAPVIREFTESALAPVLTRMAALESRFDRLPAPKDGKDADLEEVRQIIAGEVVGLKTALESAKVPELHNIPALVAEEVGKAVSGLPVAQDGKSVTVEDVAPLIASEVDKRVKALPTPKDGDPGKDGESIDPAEVQRMVSQAVEKAVASIPLPKDGADGKDGEPGRDGIGLAGAFIDRSGGLVVTLTNGETRNLGPVVGTDGSPGEKGGDGKDGRDGFGFEDLDLVETDEGLVLRFIRNDHVKEFRLPVVIDRGVYKEGQTYRPGDGCTWGGSYWICQQETTDKPDSGRGFRLAVKKGRDGRDGVMKEAKPQEPVRVSVPAKAVQ